MLGPPAHLNWYVADLATFSLSAEDVRVVGIVLNKWGDDDAWARPLFTILLCCDIDGVKMFGVRGVGDVLSRSHKGAAGMRSVLTFVKVVWIVDARVER
jgi:hypothetical protein